jgi:hypothetical protein
MLDSFGVRLLRKYHRMGERRVLGSLLVGVCFNRVEIRLGLIPVLAWPNGRVNLVKSAQRGLIFSSFLPFSLYLKSNNCIWQFCASVAFSKSVNEIKSDFLGGFKSNNKASTCVPGLLGDSPLYVEMVPSDTVVFCTNTDVILGRRFRLSVPTHTHVCRFVCVCISIPNNAIWTTWYVGRSFKIHLDHKITFTLTTDTEHPSRIQFMTRERKKTPFRGDPDSN